MNITKSALSRITFLLAFLTPIAVTPIAHSAPGAHGPNGEHLSAPPAGNAGANAGAGTAAVAGLARLPDGSVNVPKEAQRRMAIRTVVGLSETHPLTIELNGRVTVDPNAGGRVQAPVPGRLEPGPQGLPAAGQRVKKGQLLAYLHPVVSAVELGNQQASLAELRASRAIAQQRIRRLESLEGTVPQKDVDAARAELIGLNGRERAVASTLGGRQPVFASANGVIATANALAGQIVDARDILFDIVDPNRLLVEAVTTDVALAGRIVSATLAGQPAVKLSLLGSGRSLREGALPVNFRAQSGNASLAVGQPVTVLAQLSDRVKGMRLPAEALARSPANEPIVWIKASAERFIAQPVSTRVLDAGTIVVTAGLGADNRVVVAGAALINQIR